MNTKLTGKDLIESENEQIARCVRAATRKGKVSKVAYITGMRESRLFKILRGSPIKKTERSSLMNYVDNHHTEVMEEVEVESDTGANDSG